LCRVMISCHFIRFEIESGERHPSLQKRQDPERAPVRDSDGDSFVDRRAA
jgi:hypothetical protein